MAKQSQPKEWAAETFQKLNCAGCRFADTKMVGTGQPCCTFPSKLDVEDGQCLSRKGTAYSREKKETHWYKSCSSCGKEFELKSKDDPFYLCQDCIAKNAMQRAVREATVLAGATVTAYEIRQRGQLTRSDEFGSITLRTTDGRTIKLTGHWMTDGGYITCEEVTADGK